MKKHGNFKLLEKGKKFGRLTVNSFHSVKKIGKKKPQNKYYYNCICDCGNKLTVCGNSLKSGNTKSCGCLQKEIVSQRIKNKPSPNRKESGHSSLTHLYGKYKHGAKNRGYEFLLTREEFKLITSSNCYYCNKPPMQQTSNWNKYVKLFGNYIYNGIDRVDNNKGYTIQNTVPCCRNCNMAKNSLTKEEFLDLVKKIYEWKIKCE